MKEEKVIRSLKITSIAFGLVLGLFLVLNESFALFTSKLIMSRILLRHINYQCYERGLPLTCHYIAIRVK